MKPETRVPTDAERCPCCGGTEWDGVPGGRYCRKCRITYFDLPLAQSRHAARVAEACVEADKKICRLEDLIGRVRALLDAAR